MAKITISAGQVPILVQENRESTEPSSSNEKLSLNEESQSSLSSNANHVKKVEPQTSSTTIMGPYMSVGFIASVPDVLSRAVKCVRLAGWKVKVIPDDFHTDMRDDESPRKVQKVDYEYEYLSQNYENFPLEVKDSDNGIVAYIDTLGDDEEEPWVSVKCVSQKTAKVIEEHLKSFFSIVQVSHVERKVKFSMEEYQLTATTLGDELKTCFKLKQAGTNKVVAKAIFVYENEATGFAGPTLEHIETAKEFRHQGLGTSLLESIMDFYRGMFTTILSRKKDVRMYATGVSSSGAFEWLQERGFRDDYGIGDELSISLNEETAAAEAPYIVRQCMGSTHEGIRCKITSENTSPEADPLCFGVSKFCLKCQDERS